MEAFIYIDPISSTPKYLQIVDRITAMIKNKQLLRGSRLPTINHLCIELGVGRVTVVNAYEELKERGIIDATHGKGFYVKNTSTEGLKKVFMLFDAMNGYKEVLYRSLVESLGNKYNISIFFFYYNYREFCRIIDTAVGQYDHYLILPHFNFDVSEALSAIPRQKLLLLDSDVENLGDGYAAVFQNFHKDTRDALTMGLSLIAKYSRINLVLQDRFQFIPAGIISGFTEFCQNHNIPHEVIENLDPAKIRKNEGYFVISDIDLISIVRYIKDNGLTLGKDLGLISFDDTPLKSVLANGITTISTNFALMGKVAGQMIKKGMIQKAENPSALIIRSSL